MFTVLFFTAFVISSPLGDRFQIIQVLRPAAVKVSDDFQRLSEVTSPQLIGTSISHQLSRLFLLITVNNRN
jgi:hypothetical protein